MHRIRGHFRVLVGIAALAIAYVLTAKLGIALAADDLVTAVWPPTGIAVVAIVLGGRRLWPGVALGAFVTEMLAGLPPATSLAIAVGSTAAPLIVATGIDRFQVDRRMVRVRDVLVFFSLAAGAMAVSATVGTSALVAGDRTLAEAGSTWITWWVGDAMGVALIAPVALTTWRTRWSHSRAETAVLLAISSVFTFVLWRGTVPVRHLTIWLAIVAALRVGPRGAASIAFAVSGIAIATASFTPGPDDFVLLQTLNASVALVALVLAAVMHERDEITSELRDLAAELEGRVQSRTSALAEANVHLRKLDETKNAILSAVSHELRTPLTAILGFTELLATPEIRADEELTDDVVVRLEASSNRLSRLLQDLLDLSRLQHGIVEPQRERRWLMPMIDAALGDVDLSEHPLSIDIIDSPCEVDPTHFERIVHNLVCNAVKYTPSGTPICVRVRVTEDSGVDITVEDEGPGIPEVMRSAIFEPFRRLTESGHAQGAGVGLALVDRFAKMHGGSASVTDRGGHGCVFHVRMPGPTAVAEPDVA